MWLLTSLAGARGDAVCRSSSSPAFVLEQRSQTLAPAGPGMLPKWPYRPGGRPPLSPADGCHARMWARHCQVLLLSRRVRDPEFSVKPFQFYTSAVNLKNVNVCTSPTNYVRGPRSEAPACNPSSETCSGALCSRLRGRPLGAGARRAEGA